MNTTIEHEKIFFNYFLEKPQYFKNLKKGFFNNDDINQISLQAKKFYEHFHESPSKEQMKAIMKKLDEDYDTDIINSVYNVDLKEYDPDWLKETMEAWIKWHNFDKQLVKTIEYVKTQKITPNNVSEVVAKATNMISVDGTVTFNNDFGLDFFNAEDHKQDVVKTIPTGWTFADNAFGGYDQKTLVVYCGMPNVGKSVFLCNDAANFVKNGYNTLFITCEMSAQKVLKRIGSNLLNVGMDEYVKFSKDKDLVTKKLKRLSNGNLNPMGKLWIKEYPTSQATTIDIENYIKDFQETHDYKIDVVVIDYINILANWRNPNSDNLYLKIKQISEDLRAIAVKFEMLIVSATQINRSGGGWDATDMNLSDVAESAALIHTCDTIYGIIQDSMMHLENIYWLKLMKVRDGEGKNRKCKLNVDYDHMRLIETDEIIESDGR